tara:strand:- start:599 stop:787 length:189 start_codon:yes stop_codon:yes gene_type:complete
MTHQYMKQARTRLDLTQEQFALALGCTKQTINVIERGKQDCKITMQLAIECLLRRADKWPIN